jgi:PKD domain
MQIQARHLITALLAVVSFVPTAMGQQTNPVNIRPRSAAAQPGVPTVRITVDKSRVPVDETVVFTLAPASVITSPRFVVTIDFGDGSRSIVSQTEIPHQYRDPGFYTATVSAKSSGSTPPPPPNPKIPDVSLSAMPTTVATESPVTFTARLSYTYPGIKYRFAFGDGSQSEWQDQAQATHAYLTPNRYQAYVEIGVTDNRSFRQVGGSARLPIQVTQTRIGPVDLIVDPTEVAAGGVVTLTAILASQDPALTYRFYFGDGSPPSLWQANRQTTHKYLLAGRYPAYVEVGRNGKGPSLANSVVRQVSVTSTVVTPTPAPGRVTPAPSPVVTPTRSPGPSSPSPGGTSSPGVGGTTNSPDGGSPVRPGPSGLFGSNWWWLLLLALALIATYQAVKMYLASQLTFRPVVDTGVTHFEQGAEPLGINFEMVLSPNVSEGQYGLETDETSFIRSERSSNG